MIVYQAAAHSALEAAQWTNKSGAPAGTSQQGRKWTEAELAKMAEYSAEQYAKTASERETYVEYYKKFYRDGGDASAAEVALAGAGAGAGSEAGLGTVSVSGVEYTRYPTPDTTKYQYDETSGYYYDPVSSLYYDSNSQYYFNSKTKKFSYWDATHETFLPAPDKETAGKEEKKTKEKEKVKSAARIQKDMEKWAAKMNQKKERTREAEVARQESAAAVAGPGGQRAGPAEDIAFSILQRKDEQQAGDGAGLAGLAGYASEEEEEEGGTNPAELKLTDWQSLACLLCKRQFQTREKLQKHNTMSDLHKNNITEWRRQQEASSASSITYRDRAKERRNKFGDDDKGKPVPNKFKEKYMRAMEDSSSGAAAAAGGEAAPKLGEENLGNRMLQKMGWKDGLGLGKSNQGRTDIINVQKRSAQSGLGTAQANLGPGDTYKDVATKTLFSRYSIND